MIKQRLESFEIPKHAIVNFKDMNNVKEICYQDKINHNIYIKKLNENEYIDLRTGEILPCKHITNRSQNLFQVGQSLKRLRDLINTNIVDPLNCKWVTLTYADNMTDTKKLYNDFRNFMKRLRSTFTEYHIEYIVAMEPQGRGAWHAHLILIFNRKAPYIPSKTFESLWGQGFVTVRKVDNVDNVGAYLTAYLGDMEYTEENIKLLNQEHVYKFNVKEVEEIDGIKLKKAKKFIKGGRLYMYPPKFNLYRCSRGIKYPEVVKMAYGLALKKVGLVQPTFTSAHKLIDNISLKPFDKTIAYEFYNTRRVLPQD